MSTESARKILKKGQRASIISILVSLGLTIIKLVGGFLSNSTAIITDGINSFSDIMIMLVGWIGLKLAERKPTERFQYGFYKSESLATLGISVFIIIVTINLIWEGINRLIYVPQLSYPVEAVIILVISIIASGLISVYLLRVGRNINSQLLIINGKERREDVLSSLSVLAAIIMGYFGIPYVEGIITIAISILVLKVGIFSIKDSIFALMDISPSKEIEDTIKEIIETTNDIEGYDNLRLRKAGPFIFGEVSIKIKKMATVAHIERITNELEQKIRNELKQIDSFIVKVKPYKTPTAQLIIPIDDNKGLQSKISEHFGRAKYFFKCIIENNKLKEYKIIKNPFIHKEVRAGLAAIKMLLKDGVDIVISQHFGEISYYTLHDHLVEMYKPECKIVNEILNEYFSNKLKPLSQPTKEKEKVEV